MPRNFSLTPKEIAQLVSEGDALVFTSLQCPDCRGRIELDVEPPDSVMVELRPVVVCTECGRAASASHHISSPRDTAQRQG